MEDKELYYPEKVFINQVNNIPNFPKNIIYGDMNNKLIITNLYKSFCARKVFNNLSFTVKDGEFLSIVAPSSCGKTTILRILIGLESPDSGQILRDNENITTLYPWLPKMGIVFKNYALFENMTVFKNVEYTLLKSSATKNLYTREQAREKAGEMLNLVGLREYFDRKPRELSGGQQQRVTIARTNIKHKTILNTIIITPMLILSISHEVGLITILGANGWLS